jgi:hypothetical protein
VSSVCVVVAAPSAAETPSAEASPALKAPPPLPPNPIVTLDNLSKRAIDDVVAEFGAPSTNAEDGASASPRRTDFQVRPQSTTDGRTAFQGRPEHTTDDQVPPQHQTVVQVPLQTTASKPVASAAKRIIRATEDPPTTPAAPTIAPSPTGYQPDADKRWTVYYLASSIIALALFCMAPALPHWNLGAAPAWARAVLLVSLLQLAYGAWVASIPDWATLRISMIVLTAIAALYGLTMTVALTTPPENALPLDLTDVRRQAVLWCAGVLLLASLVAYFCGRAAWRWRRTLELLKG